MAVPLINGKAYVWADIVATINGAVLTGIMAIKYEEKQEKVNNYGQGSKPTSRGLGKIEYDASLTLSMEELERLQSASPNGRLIEVAPFSLTVTFEKGALTKTHVLKDCEFMSNGRDMSEGDTEITQEIPIIISDIDWGLI